MSARRQTIPLILEPTHVRWSRVQRSVRTNEVFCECAKMLATGADGSERLYSLLFPMLIFPFSLLWFVQVS